MTYLLDAAYLFALLLASPWLLWRSLRTGRYREGFGAKLLGIVPRANLGRPRAFGSMRSASAK